MRDENDGLQARGAGVGRHGGRGVAGGNARHAPHAQAQRLRDAARHAVVLERAGRVEALVLEHQAVEPAVLRGARRIEQRRVAFAQRDHGAVIGQERDELAESPDAALVERRVGGAPGAPQSAQFPGRLGRAVVDRLQQPPAPRAVIDDFVYRETRAAALLETGKLGGHEAFIIAGPMQTEARAPPLAVDSVAARFLGRARRISVRTARVASRAAMSLVARSCLALAGFRPVKSRLTNGVLLQCA